MGIIGNIKSCWQVVTLLGFLGLATVPGWSQVPNGVDFGEPGDTPHQVRVSYGSGSALSAEDRKRVAEIEEYRKSGFGNDFRNRFSDFNKVEYANVWLHLADTYTKPQEIAVALRLANNLHSKNPVNKLAPWNSKLTAVIFKHLRAKDPRVLEVALDGATWSVAKPDPHKKTAEMCMDIAESHPSGDIRLRALYALWVYPSRDNRFSEFVLKSLRKGNDPGTLSYGLGVVSAQYKENAPFPARIDKAIVARTWELMEHQDPRVSTRAISCQRRLFSHRRDEIDAVGKRLIKMLKDPRGYAKTRAALTLAELDYEPSIHSIVLLLNDGSENSYGEGGLKQYTSRQHRVDDAALASLHDLTEDLRHLRFVYSIRENKYDPKLQSEVIKEAKRAKQWYQKNKDSLPKSP